MESAIVLSILKIAISVVAVGDDFGANRLISAPRFRKTNSYDIITTGAEASAPRVCQSIRLCSGNGPPLVVHRAHRLTYISSAVAFLV
jgi:hypothetical protein